MPFAAVAVRPTLISLDGLAAGFAIIVHLGLQSSDWPPHRLETANRDMG